MTLGELKELTKHMSDDTLLIAVDSNYELRGAYTDTHAKIARCKKVRQSFRDDFDGTHYSTEVYEYTQDGDGQEVVIFL